MNISVIVPCFNEEQTIKTLIKSVEESQVNIKEIIVVNDGSTDNTLKVLKEIKSSKITRCFGSSQNVISC